MNTATWTVQIVLAALFFPHGLLFLAPIPPLRTLIAERMGISSGFAYFLGAAELLGAAGLILPRWTGILTWLTPLAAIGLVIIMAGAIVFHLRERQTPQAVATVVILLLAVIVVMGTVTL